MPGEKSKIEPQKLIAAPAIESRIFFIWGRQVMVDEDLADLYGVETKRLVEQMNGTWSGSRKTSCFSSIRTRLRL